MRWIVLLNFPEALTKFIRGGLSFLDNGYMRKTFFVASTAVFGDPSTWKPLQITQLPSRKNGIKRGERHWARSRDHKLMRQVLDRVRDQGPLKARDFEDTRSGSTGWWDWKPAKRALEQLFMQGDLMSAGRDGFQKRYEIPERILPSDIDTTEPTHAEYAGYLIDTMLRAHGFATATSFTYGRRGTAIRAAVKTLLAERVDAGTLATAKLNDDLFYGTPAVFDAQSRTPAPVVRILSPFDNAIIQRARSSNIFDFDFQLECYVTETERKWGYYCLPILFADKFVGRMDCKTHRATGTFEIKQLHVETPLPEAFYAAFAETVLDYAAYQQCGAVTVTSVKPARHAKRFKTLFHG